MPNQWITDVFQSNIGWNHLESLVDLDHRMPGSDGERRAADLTREAFEEAGARDVNEEMFEIPGWDRGTATLIADSTGQEYNCLALPRSPAAERTGRLVDLSWGNPDNFQSRDLKGAIVLVRGGTPDYFSRFVRRQEKYARAVDAGAAGFVYTSNLPGNIVKTGSVWGPTEGDTGAIPAVGVSKEVGARLRRLCLGNQLTIRVDCTISHTESRNVFASVGPQTDSQILVTAHLDAHDIGDGAGDNGAGVAMLVELAEAIAGREVELDTGVQFIAFGAEEIGYLGSHHAAERMDLSTVKAVYNNDGVARGPTLQFFTHGFENLAAVISDTFDRFDHPVEVSPEHNPTSDHWPFVQRGIPGMSATARAGGKGEGWSHTAADTLDKLERRHFREQAILGAELILRLAESDCQLQGRSADDLAADLTREQQAKGLKATGDWPY